MILLIDNYDSFTYNLMQLLLSLHQEVLVKRNDEISIEEIDLLHPEVIVFSPGPGRPEHSGLTMEIIQAYQNKTPMLGVCLGYQALGQAFGADVIYAPEIFHGKTSVIKTSKTSFFSALPQKIKVGRYHSLVLDRNTLPDCLEILAETDDGIIMAIKHKEKPLYGVQFHPESILTEYGAGMVEAFLEEINDERS